MTIRRTLGRTGSYARPLVAALRVPGMSPADRGRLHRLEQTFEAVSEDTDPLRWVKAWVPTRLDRHYLPAVVVARLLLQNLSFRDAVGGATATTFLVDMNKLVEAYISEHLRRLCRGRLEVRKQFSLFLDDERRVNIRPDLVFFGQKQRVFVADIKYKAVATIDDTSTADSVPAARLRNATWFAVWGIDHLHR